MKQKILFSVSLILATDQSLAQEATLIAPMIEGTRLCQSAIDQRHMFNNVSEALIYCTEKDESGSQLLENKLAKLGPAISPNGQFELGYMIGLPLLSYVNIDTIGQLSINKTSIRNDLRILSELDRKAVLYLFANHFINSSYADQAKQIASNSAELMTLADGSNPADNYFSSTIYPWRVNAPSSKFSEARALAANAVMEELCALPEVTLNKVKAITTLGEIHYFFKNFKQGMGYNNEYQITDYSPESLLAFQQWLKKKFKSIQNLNHQLDAIYSGFDQVQFPKQSTFDKTQYSAWLDRILHFGKPDVSRLMHLDHNAYGSVPFFGWAKSKDGSPIEIHVYLDGHLVGNAETGLTRLDVAQALPELTDGSTGYRYDLDYKNLSDGIHSVELRFAFHNKEYLLRKYQLEVVAPKDVLNTQKPITLNNVPAINESEIRFWPDYPSEAHIKIRYNPLAELWLEFREAQITHEIERYADIISSHCIPKDKVFSHQIAPAFNPTWDATLFAASGSLRQNTHYNLGLNLYGSAIYKEKLFDWLAENHHSRYGIPEMHPMLPEAPNLLEEALIRHHQQGAVFLSPYFMSLIPDDVIVDAAHDKYRLSPINQNYGSKEFYQAIQNIMQQ